MGDYEVDRSMSLGEAILNDLYISLNNTFRGGAFGFIECELKGLTHVLLVRADAGDADRGALPYFLMICFGDRHIELRSKAVFQAANYHSLVFERLRVRDGDLEREQGDGNYRVPATFSVIKASMTSPTLRSLKFWIPMPHS